MILNPIVLFVLIPIIGTLLINLIESNGKKKYRNKFEISKQQFDKLVLEREAINQKIKTLNSHIYNTSAKKNMFNYKISDLALD